MQAKNYRVTKPAKPEKPQTRTQQQAPSPEHSAPNTTEKPELPELPQEIMNINARAILTKPSPGLRSQLSTSSVNRFSLTSLNKMNNNHRSKGQNGLFFKRNTGYTSINLSFSKSQYDYLETLVKEAGPILNEVLKGEVKLTKSFNNTSIQFSHLTLFSGIELSKSEQSSLLLILKKNLSALKYKEKNNLIRFSSLKLMPNNDKRRAFLSLDLDEKSKANVAVIIDIVAKSVEEAKLNPENTVENAKDPNIYKIDPNLVHTTIASITDYRRLLNPKDEAQMESVNNKLKQALPLNPELLDNRFAFITVLLDPPKTFGKRASHNIKIGDFNQNMHSSA